MLGRRVHWFGTDGNLGSRSLREPILSEIASRAGSEDAACLRGTASPIAAGSQQGANEKQNGEVEVKQLRRNSAASGTIGVDRESTASLKGRSEMIKETTHASIALQQSKGAPPAAPELPHCPFDIAALQTYVSESMVTFQSIEPKEIKGVWLVDNAVPAEVRQLLTTKLDAIAELPEKDFQPGSNNQVQNVVPHAMFPYVQGLSIIKDGRTVPMASMSSTSGSAQSWTYQSLPSQFYVEAGGRVQIRSYINNLEEAPNADLYRAIEVVFAAFLPMFEAILDRSLRSRELQVIVKASNSVIPPQCCSSPYGVYDGSWLREGMAHEHIVASGMYFYSTSPVLKDEGLQFRPLPHYCNLSIARRSIMGGLIRRRRFLPEGHVINPRDVVPTPEDRLLAFPNHLLHKARGIRNDSGLEVGTRKMLMFSLVDPDVEITSTRDVAEQQWDRVSLQQEKVMGEVAEKIIGRSFPLEIVGEILSRAKTGLTLAEARLHRLEFLMERRSAARNQLLF